MSAAEQNSLDAYLDTPVKLFIADRVLLKQTLQALPRLGFRQVGAVKVKNNYFQAMRQLFGEVVRYDGLVLVNHPPRLLKDSRGVAYQDMSFTDFYRGVASFNKSSRRSSHELLQRCIPVMVTATDSDIRQRVLEDLFPFGIMAAFMLEVLPLGISWEDQVEYRLGEYQQYFEDFFLHRDHKLAELKEYKSAEELRKRREKAEKIMAEVQRLKEAKEYDKAVALCREAIEVLPTDPEAYLEGGRLLVKRRKYPPAMQMFRDAEKVAQDLPAPNQEIANLRVQQVKDYVTQRRQAGLAVDQEVVSRYLGEALDNFQEAIAKAEKMPALRSEVQDQRRKDAAAAIAENILTLELAETVGQEHPLVRKLGHLAQETLTGKVKGEGELDPRYVVQFGLLAFFDGELNKALRFLLEAAKVKETFEDACKKLNYIGTQLRRRGQYDLAVKVYRRLLGLRPSFRATVLFNLAVALASKLAAEADPRSPEGRVLQREAMAIAAEAIYVDPSLSNDENFYANTVMAPLLRQTRELLSAVVGRAGGEDPLDRKCRLASRKLEGLLDQGKDMEALRFMFSLTRSLKEFFLHFDRHATPRVLDFARRLLPLLAKHPKPQMRTFGKVLGILVQRGESAVARPVPKLNPALQPVMDALHRMDQAGAARELVRALVGQPTLLRDASLTADATLVNLCREIVGKMESIDLERFGAQAQAA